MEGVKLWTGACKTVDENASSPSGNNEGVNYGLEQGRLWMDTCLSAVFQYLSPAHSGILYFRMHIAQA